ncbi:MAG TPA: hypothetical protein PKJ03_10780, partial [Methanoregulaceae archaeon]|nr:hypothetical protein [Methanoregulaceae archaeon]
MFSPAITPEVVKKGDVEQITRYLVEWSIYHKGGYALFLPPVFLIPPARTLTIAGALKSLQKNNMIPSRATSIKDENAG